MQKLCENCGASFRTFPSQADKRRCCSKSCSATIASARGFIKKANPRVDFACDHCGKIVKMWPSQIAAARRFCSRACSSNGRRVGTIDKNGYRVMEFDGVQIAEHRLVVEKRLGRKLLPHETVHHVNGQRADNADSNLELWSTAQPKGQRVADKIAWAKSLLTEYGVPHSTMLAGDVIAGLGALL